MIRSNVNTMKNSYIQINGIKVHYLMSGNGEVLLLLPSIWLTSKSYIPLGLELSKGFKVIIPDIYRGNSVFNKYVMNIQDYVEALHDFTKALSIKNFYLVGISFSGFIATKYTLKYSTSINKLFLVSTTPIPLLFKNKKLILIYGYMKLFFHNMFSLNGVKTNLIWMCDGVENLLKHPKQVIFEGLMATSNYDDQVTDMKIPTKLIFAQKDEFIPLDIVSRVKKITNLEIETVDHYHAWFFKREDELANRIVSFFKVL